MFNKIISLFMGILRNLNDMTNAYSICLYLANKHRGLHDFLKIHYLDRCFYKSLTFNMVKVMNGLLISFVDKYIPHV